MKRVWFLIRFYLLSNPTFTEAEIAEYAPTRVRGSSPSETRVVT